MTPSEIRVYAESHETCAADAIQYPTFKLLAEIAAQLAQLNAAIADMSGAHGLNVWTRED